MLGVRSTSASGAEEGGDSLGGGDADTGCGGMVIVVGRRTGRGGGGGGGGGVGGVGRREGRRCRVLFTNHRKEEEEQ